MTRRGRLLFAAGAIVVAQASAFVVFRSVESNKAASIAFDVEPIDPPQATPPVSFEQAPGREATVPLNSLKRPTLVHFWATWCVPCREELPALLDAADKDALGASVLAVSVDESWPVIQAFKDGRHPAIARLDHDAAKAAFALGPLPVTLLVDESHLLRARFRGAQPWSNTKEAARLIASFAPAEAR